MTKQEKIQEEYGEYWNKDIEENGWVRLSINTEKKIVNYLINKELFDSRVETTKDAYYTFFRLKSLQGIENNNGWIKIEGEADLPDIIEGLWEIVMNGEQRFIELLKDNKERLYKDFIKDGVTHYKIIEKSQQPIY